MRARFGLTALSAVAAAHVFGLTPPSKSDGPVRLLSCVVSGAGILEAEVDSTSDAPMSCDITCNYRIGDNAFSHWFNETIPARYNGRVGKFDTSGAKAGNYPGQMGACQRTASRQTSQ
jgi:hypothetical protein